MKKKVLILTADAGFGHGLLLMLWQQRLMKNTAMI
jgi:hypothetical protein